MRGLWGSIFNIAIGKLRLLFSFSQEELIDELHPFIRRSVTSQGEIATSTVLLSDRCQIKKKRSNVRLVKYRQLFKPLYGVANKVHLQPVCLQQKIVNDAKFRVDNVRIKG